MLGYTALKQLIDSIERHIQVYWIDPTTHLEAWRKWTEAQGTELTFVDWTTGLASNLLRAPIFASGPAFADYGFSVVTGLMDGV